MTASGASTYQWSKNGTPISGATQASYYSPAITAANAGDVYAVTIGNANGNTLSNNASISINPNTDGSPPASFWGDGTIPTAQQVMTVKFVNATNGKYPDSQVFWGFNGKTADGTSISELHAFSDAPTYDMPAVSSARMYFYIASSASATGTGSTNYYDFIEFNIGRSSSSQPWGFNGDTTRVDAFGLKTAIHLHCADGTDRIRGEDYGTFLEDRAITFQKYLAEVPSAFAATATQNAPYRIVEPGAAGFGANGANATYFNSYIDTVWANNNIDTSIIPKPTPFLDFVSNQYPDLTAALERHVADKPGTFNADGTLVDPSFWSKQPSSSFYASGPANFYARYWHTHGIAGLAYGFPYDDVGSYSSDIACSSPQYLVVAIGW